MMRIKASDMYMPSKSRYPVEYATLAAGLLARMINDYLYYELSEHLTPEQKLDGIHARMWLYEEHEYKDSDNGIHAVCAVLDCDPDWVIRKVEAMRDMGILVNEHSLSRTMSCLLGRKRGETGRPKNSKAKPDCAS